MNCETNMAQTIRQNIRGKPGGKHVGVGWFSDKQNKQMCVALRGWK
jgi:hypothetical protein